MNQNHPLPNDPNFEPETPEVAERLDAVERRLKATRPRPPRLDASVGKRGRPYHRMAIAACTWTSGAVVGAVMMFVVMRHAVSPVDTPVIEVHQATAQSEQEDRPEVEAETIPAGNSSDEVEPVVEQREAPASGERFEPYETNRAIAMLAFDRLDIGGSPYGRDGPTLRAGMFQMRDGGDSRRDDPARSVVGVSRGENERVERTERPEFVPSPPVTRERLLKELLEGNW